MYDFISIVGPKSLLQLSTFPNKAQGFNIVRHTPESLSTQRTSISRHQPQQETSHSFLTRSLTFIVCQPITIFTALFDAHFGSLRILFPMSARNDSSSHIWRAHIVCTLVQGKNPHAYSYGLMQEIRFQEFSMNLI